MSKFFESQQVKDSIEEIQKMQADIYKDSIGYVAMNAEQRIEHIDKMAVLLEKQRILHTRMQLDPDPLAKEMLDKMRMTATSLGIPDNVSFDELFKNMDHIIKTMKMGIQPPA